MSDEPRMFPLRTILTVTTGLLLTNRRGPQDNGIGDLYEILDWMTGDAAHTHQLPRFADECRPEILKQHPVLDDPGIRAHLEDARDAGGDEAIEMALSGFAAAYGAELPLRKLPEGVHAAVHPVAELVGMMDGTKGGEK